jgi:hypothetical protein
MGPSYDMKHGAYSIKLSNVYPNFPTYTIGLWSYFPLQNVVRKLYSLVLSTPTLLASGQ